MFEFLSDNILLYEQQSGFVPGHADTQKQSMLMKNNESNKVTRGVFFDIAGAFDAVPHYLLLK
jgi:hypothetical protein